MPPSPSPSPSPTPEKTPSGAAARSRSLRWVKVPRQARSQQTLGRLLDAAEELVAEKGFADTAVAEVALRARSSVGAFYARFRDKEGLLHALYERYLEQAMATADDALDPVRWEGAGVAEILDSVVRFIVEIYRERGGLIRAFVVRNHTDAEFAARQERLSHHVATRLSELLLARRHEIRRADAERAIAFALMSAFATVENTVLFGEARSFLALSDEELASELTHSILAYLDVDPSSQSPTPSAPAESNPSRKPR